MGWGLLITNVFINKIYKSELPTKIEDAEQDLKDIEAGLIALAASISEDITIDGGDFTEPRHVYVAREVRKMLHDYGDASGRLSLLYQATESFEVDIDLIELGCIARLKRWWNKEEAPLIPKEVKDN